MISKKDIEHLAKLARIDVTESEKEKAANDLQAILEYVKVLEHADAGDEAFTHFAHLQTSLREDVKEPDESETARRTRMIESAPKEENGYIKVKSILDK